MRRAMSTPDLIDFRMSGDVFGILLFFEMDDNGIVIIETPNRL